MVKQNREALVEAVKEFIRTTLLAAIPVVIEGLSAGRINYTLILISVLTAVLRALDSGLHDSTIPVKGISPV